MDYFHWKDHCLFQSRSSICLAGEPFDHLGCLIHQDTFLEISGTLPCLLARGWETKILDTILR